MHRLSRCAVLLLAWASWCACLSVDAFAAPSVQAFSPTGTVKRARQVIAHFATPMVALGDPRARAPFEIDCPAEGRGRWLDPQRWVFDFNAELPAGIRCRFRLRDRVRDLGGTPLTGAREFAFDSGGPAVLQVDPWEGSTIDEAQVFVLGLDGPALPERVRAHARCRVDGLAEALDVELVTGDARRTLLENNPHFLRRYVRARYADPVAEGLAARQEADEALVRTRFEALLDERTSPIVLLKCRRPLPNGARVWLDWGTGIAGPSGLENATTQSFTYDVRAAFRARATCERVHAGARCIPALGMSLEFTAAVPRTLAREIELRDTHGRRYPVDAGDADNAEYTWSVRVPGPLPARTEFEWRVPALTDDAGRPLVNLDRFPLAVATDDDPPLAKFAADFGIVEAGAAALLPVTVRNLEANLKHVAPPRGHPPERDVLFNPVVTTLRGRSLRMDAADPVAFGRWLIALREAQRNHYTWDESAEKYVVTRRAGETELLGGQADARPLEVPRRAHAKAFEVVGIPLHEPGLYLVELASPRLGAALFGKPGVYFAQSLALVTNLGVHLKWGRESSLVWVTALDSGQPVPDAAVTLKDCAGRALWQGRTDRAGVAAIAAALPVPGDLPRCDWNPQGLFVTAQVGNDIGIVSSEWNEGIENWQFNLPGPSWRAPSLGATVFDRTLLRSGETVHMKHVLRRHTGRGFDLAAITPFTVRVRHAGSGQEFPLAAPFDPATATAESTWTIPADAPQGTYHVEYAHADGWLPLGEFRVETYRVPLLRATLAPAAPRAIAPASLEMDVQVNYLAGGAAQDLPVTLRGLVRPRDVHFDGYDDFVFMNGDVPAGETSAAEAAWRAPPEPAGERAEALASRTATLDATGSTRLTVDDLPRDAQPRTLIAEIEYQDPNGAILTSATSVPLWPASIALGLKPDGWALSQPDVRFQVQALTIEGRAAPALPVTVDLFQRITYSHRKRLLGGFYAYEHRTELEPLGQHCSGTTDSRGRLDCRIASPVAGNVILRASATDPDGHVTQVHRDVWVTGKEEWWFGGETADRMDVLPEMPRYEPGDTARLQVRMPFRTATALVTVEREGVMEHFVTRLSGRAPVVDVPIRGAHAPNVFVSVLAVRGRDGQVAPGATIDLGKPAYRLGVARLRVGWRAHQLNVKVKASRDTYRVRETARVAFEVAPAAGGRLAAPAELAVAAVDEGLLELRENSSWRLLDAMMNARGTEVRTATAQMQVIGKRHFGRKAVLPGGGGGTGTGTRQLFDTLLAWHGRVKLDRDGRATLDIPLNDSLSSFRIVAIATAGAGTFGTGETRVQTTQDIMLFAGLPPEVRESDRFSARFTVRNASAAARTLNVVPALAYEGDVAFPAPALPPRTLALEAGASGEVAWDVTVPVGARRLAWTLRALDPADEVPLDSLQATQQVRPAVPVRTWQAGMLRLDAPRDLAVAPPADAVPGRGALTLRLTPRLSDALDGVHAYMEDYPYACLEQRVSRAVAREDADEWSRVMSDLPAHLDAQGLARYFAGMDRGSDTLTAYVLAIAAARGWTVPEPARRRLREGLVAFIEGRTTIDSAWQVADLQLRRLTAIAALSRDADGIDPRWLDAITITPQTWPTSALLDWIEILQHTSALPSREVRRAEAWAALRARTLMSGTTLTFTTEHTDDLWWLMQNTDVNASRTLLAALEEPGWQDDLPRLVTGSIARQRQGHWSTTNANAWGAVALRRFSARHESTPVAGTSRATLTADTRTIDWSADGSGGALEFALPTGATTLSAAHAGTGAPWLAWQLRAAVPLETPLEAGYRIERTVVPSTPRADGTWHAGDLYRVHLDIVAQSDMTWVVVDDPLPAGAMVLAAGTVAGADPGGDTTGPSPTYEERTFQAYRAYFEFLPQGRARLEYTVRLNNPGVFVLPPTRVEALYAPDRYAELPLAPLTVLP